ncbi:MAG: tRNA (uridine(34)/cytosine(34)/5-carboxymethylaminomethyluridine(34)-2'-O)-methyltransferase TrmL [Clostridia bacterium]|nr:tRNA (uridine(34)/cytosine(34)/5-carboxymethylaminomethyluridine(34)-2'-O)-methyltransferase TrmL [Clostridia bacterium]
MHVVLVNPEIPQNTGNIARTCAATGLYLHLIKPLGFSLDDRYMKRAGLDYWHMAKVEVHESWRDFRNTYPSAEMYFFTTKAKKTYVQFEYPDDAFLVFGRETKGLDEDMLICHIDRCARIPMMVDARSLNLSNSVAVVVYEALRQHDFKGLSLEGEMHGTAAGNWIDYV